MATPATCKRLPDHVEVGLERSRAGGSVLGGQKLAAGRAAAASAASAPDRQGSGDVGAEGSGAGIVRGTAATVMK